MPAVTRDMISAAHGVTLKSGDVILSADLLTRIYRAMRAREPKEGGNRAAEMPDCFWNDDARYDTPTDCEIMQGRELGEVFTLTAAWYRPVLFKVVKVPDDASDDYAVEVMPCPT